MIDIVDSISKEQGYIYVIKVLDYYKIGKTQNPNNRFGEYTKLMKEPEVVILKKVSNYNNVEVELHKMFSHKHTRGEWYELNDNDIEIIQWYLNYFDNSMIPFLLSIPLSDLLKSQIQYEYNDVIEIREQNSDLYIILRTGKTLQTRIPIYHNVNYNGVLIDDLSNILEVLSKNREMIEKSLQIQKELSEHAS